MRKYLSLFTFFLIPLFIMGLIACSQIDTSSDDELSLADFGNVNGDGLQLFITDAPVDIDNVDTMIIEVDGISASRIEDEFGAGGDWVFGGEVGWAAWKETYDQSPYLDVLVVNVTEQMSGKRLGLS